MVNVFFKTLIFSTLILKNWVLKEENCTDTRTVLLKCLFSILILQNNVIKITSFLSNYKAYPFIVFKSIYFLFWG